MASTLDTRRRVSYRQLEMMWEFLNTERELATGYNKSAQARDQSKRFWTNVAEALNAERDGAMKDWKGWSNYWVDYKAKLKRKYAVLNKAFSSGGSPTLPLLNDLENRYLGLLSDGTGTGAPVRINPGPAIVQLSSSPQDTLPFFVQVKVEENVQCPPNLPNTESNSEASDPLPETNTPRPCFERTSRPIRRRRRVNHISQEGARRSLIDISRERLAIEKKNHVVFQEMLGLMKRFVDRFESAPGCLGIKSEPP